MPSGSNSSQHKSVALFSGLDCLSFFTHFERSKIEPKNGTSCRNDTATAAAAGLAQQAHEQRPTLSAFVCFSNMATKDYFICLTRTSP